MKHIVFTAVVVLSLVSCVLFIGVTAATLNSSWEVQLGQTENGRRARSAGAHYGELVYNDRLTADFGRPDLTKTTVEHLGFVVHKEVEPAVSKTNDVEFTSYQYALSPAYPIILFAMPPLAWLVDRLGGRKQKAARGVQASEEPGGTPPDQR